jgi:hypothetical protein
MKRIVHRSAIRGCFVRPEYAWRHPKTTVREVITIRRKRIRKRR